MSLLLIPSDSFSTLWIASHCSSAYCFPALSPPLGEQLTAAAGGAPSDAPSAAHLGVLSSELELEHDAQFDAWLHVELDRFEAGAFALLTLCWASQAWLSAYHPTELMITATYAVLCAFRCAHPGKRDGQAWCACLALSHAAEAYTVAFGTVESATAIAASRVAYREVAFAVCLLIGLLHGTQVRHLPASPRLSAHDLLLPWPSLSTSAHPSHAPRAAGLEAAALVGRAQLRGLPPPLARANRHAPCGTPLPPAARSPGWRGRLRRRLRPL